MNLRDIASKVKGYIQSKTQDDEGWIRQGNFAPKQQVQQMGQNLNAWGNIAKQGINNQINIQKRDFNDFVWQPIKANPFLQPIAQKYENALPAIKNQLNPFKPLDRKQNWEDSKKIGSAALTTAGLMASPAVKMSSMLGGAVISPIITAGMNLLEKKPIGEGVVESIPVGAGQGLANAGTTRLTNYLVQGLANKIPVLKSLTEEAIKKGVPAAGDTLKEGFKKLVNTGGKRLIKAAVLETAVESPIWTTLTQTEQETYLQALSRETQQNLAMNIGMAGVNTAMDSRAMGSIIKKSVDTAIENYMKSASTPEALKNQGGYLNMFGGIVDGTKRTEAFDNAVGILKGEIKPKNVSDISQADNTLHQLAKQVIGEREYKNIMAQRYPDPNYKATDKLIDVVGKLIRDDIPQNTGYKEPMDIPHFKDYFKSEKGAIDFSKNKPFPQSNLSPESVSKVDGDLLSEAKKYKSAEDFVNKNDPVKYTRDNIFRAEKGIDYDYEEYGPKMLALNLSANDLVKGKGITKEYTLNALKDAYENGASQIQPSLGAWTKEGKGFMDTLVRDGWVRKTSNGTYFTTEKIKNWETKSTLTDIWNKANLSPESEGIKVKPNDDLVTKFDETIKVVEQPKIKVSPLEMPKPPEIKQRGFSTSVQEAPNVNKQVKQEVLGGYEPKQNEVLMGEAKGLLEEGVDVDLRNIKDIDKKVAATMQEAINQQKTNPQLAANLFNNLSEKGTELGRGVQAFALLKRMSPESIALSASGLIKKYNRLNPTKQIPELNGDQVKIISDKVAELDLLKGREKNIALNELNEIINSFIPSKLTDKLLTVWKAGLLTSLRTHERNFVGNAIHGVMEIAKDIPAAITDMGLSKITGQRSKTFTVKGLGEFGSKKTGQQMIDIVKRGFDPTEQINKFDYKKVNWGNNLIEKGLKKYTDTVFRTLGASDKPFYNAALARSLYDQAAVAAINAGKKGNKQFIEALVSKPTEEMLKIAIGDANVSTFKDKNAATNVVNQLKQALGKNQFSKVIGEITMPFTGVPTSILGQIQAYSPIGLVKGIYKVGKVASGKVPELQRQASEELGRGVIGTGIFGLGAYLAGQGLITGQPKDATEARQWELENKPRNSIMIGGKWRSLNSIGPEAVVFLAGAKLNEELNSEGGNLGTYGLKIGKDYLDQSFVTGLQQPVNALTDPARYGKSYLGNQLSSFIPNIIKDFSKSIDPNAREANTVMDYAKLGTPARLGMIEKRDALGNVIPQEPTGVGAFIDLFNSKTPRSSETIKELSRLYKVGESATPSKLTASQTIIPGQEKVKLTFEQLNNLEKGVGEILQPQLEKLVTSPVYQKLTDEKKANAISNLVSDVRSKYKLQNANSLTGGKVNISGGYVDKSGSFKEVNTDTIPKPEYTGNATIDKKLKTQYENAIEKQKVDIALSKQNQEVSGLQKEYSYIDENGNYKSVDLSPVQFPELTGDTIVDKKLKSSYYSEINAQINNVIKLNKAGEITQDEMIKMVTALNKQYTAGKGGKKPKKITAKIIKITSPKANIKFSSPRASKFKLKPSPKIKITKTDNRKYTIKA